MFRIKIRKINPFPQVRSREFVGIDFSGNSLKLAHVRISSGKKEIVSLLTRNISTVNDDDLPRIIESSFLGLNVQKPHIINVIPSNLVITKNIEIPSINPLEIKEIINLQAGRHTPYSREEIIVDYIDIGTYKHSYTKILLVIVARKVIKRQFDILDKTGLKVEKVFFASEGLAGSISKILKLETKETPINIIHIDEGFSDFTIVFKDKAIFNRSLPIGAQHLISEKERYEMRFAEEIKKSLEAYQSEDIEKNPSTFVLTGAVGELKDLERTLGDLLHLPIRIMPYLRNLLVTNGALKTATEAKYISFLNVIAPLLAYEDLKVDLIPEEIKLRRSLEDRGKDLIKTGIFVLAIFVLTFSILISKIYFKSFYLNKLNKQYQSLSQEADKLEKEFSTIKLLKNYLSMRGYPLEVLTELYNILPLDLKLTDVKFDEQGKFSVRGTSDSMSIVFSFVESMEKSKYFKDAKTKYTTKRKEGLKDVTDFEINCLLDKEG